VVETVTKAGVRNRDVKKSAQDGRSYKPWREEEREWVL
jgi:hypothetical protein